MWEAAGVQCFQPCLFLSYRGTISYGGGSSCVGSRRSVSGKYHCKTRLQICCFNDIVNIEVLCSCSFIATLSVKERFCFRLTFNYNLIVATASNRLLNQKLSTSQRGKLPVTLRWPARAQVLSMVLGTFHNWLHWTVQKRSLGRKTNFGIFMAIKISHSRKHHTQRYVPCNSCLRFFHFPTTSRTECSGTRNRGNFGCKHFSALFITKGNS